MRNTFGNALCVTIYGESHGKSIGAVIDGLPSGLEVNLEYIKQRHKIQGLFRHEIGRPTRSRRFLGILQI